MIFTKILPALFSIVMVVGFFLLINGFFGLLAKKNYAPVKDDKNNTIFSIVNGKDAFSWGKICFYASFPFLITSAIGFYVSAGFFNSPAYLVNLIDIPGHHDILYSVKRDDALEVAYGFNENTRVVHSRLKRQLEINDWKIIKTDPIVLVAKRDKEYLTINFIGFQMGDNRIYPTKTILILRQVQ